MGSRALLHISFLVLIASSFTVLALNDDILSTNNIAQPPSTSLPPVPSPNKPPHKHRHHRHKHPLAPAPSPLPPPPPPPKPPTHPSSPPPKAPVHPSLPPPPKAPAHPSLPPPPKAPAHPSLPPPPKAPAHPPPPPPKAHTPPPPIHHSPPPPPPPSPTVPKKPIAVRGLVYCKSCKYKGVDNLYKAKPIKGAVVKLACNNTKYHLSVTTKTDKNGFFLFYMPKIVSSAGYRKCKVYLVKSPLSQCSEKTNYKLGKDGAPLIPTPLKLPAPYNLYTVGPFAFEPSKKVLCPR
ncbi:PREDICTED: non-classical arabinogalactan protein 30-like [Ipomoea nil]|uniref:non-classical arabinogalactan protein 30-like n=1 Tax=Ipomoea nil TaxID=35883 RepID=UPI000900F657|nr:PREDICTED: non-classical arabinogalactan protein 30-like [Ipomoea nil]